MISLAAFSSAPPAFLSGQVHRVKVHGFSDREVKCDSFLAPSTETNVVLSSVRRQKRIPTGEGVVAVNDVAINHGLNLILLLGMEAYSSYFFLFEIIYRLS